MVLIFVFLLLAFIYYIRVYRYTRGATVEVYFAPPGAGKSTFAAHDARRDLRHGVPAFTNFAVKDCYSYNPKEDLGYYLIKDSNIYLDEAAIDYNNRNFKNNLTAEQLEFYKTIRKYGCNLRIYSQSYEDMDITFRRLATRFYLVKKSLIPGFVYCRQIRMFIGIDKETEKIDDKYKFIPFTRRYIFAPLVWKYFDSYNYKDLPVKEFKKYD